MGGVVGHFGHLFELDAILEEPQQAVVHQDEHLLFVAGVVRKIDPHVDTGDGTKAAIDAVDALHDLAPGEVRAVASPPGPRARTAVGVPIMDGGGVALGTPDDGSSGLDLVAADTPQLHEAVTAQVDLKHGAITAFAGADLECGGLYNVLPNGRKAPDSFGITRTVRSEPAYARGRIAPYYSWVPLYVFLESTVVLAASSLAAAALTAALGYVLEREWPAVVFLLTAAGTTIWYGMIFVMMVRALAGHA